MSYETIIVERDGPIAIVTINRPEKLNALNSTVREELSQAFTALGLEDEVRVAILCGSGDKAFVAGADVTEFAARSAHEQRQLYLKPRVYDVVAAFPKPLIAAIHGHCIGGGCELALACDIRVADRTARFAQAEIRLGIIPGAGGTQRLARLVGPGQAMRMALSGDVVEAEEAYRIGLVEFLVDDGEQLEKAKEVAGRIARWSPLAHRLVKQSIRAAMEMPLSAGLEYEKELFLTAFASEDAQEGFRAFVEKRRAEFKGR